MGNNVHNIIEVLKNGTTEVFENTLGHKIGPAMIQILFRDGGQRVINGFDDVVIKLSDEGANKFLSELEAAEAAAEQEAKKPVDKDNVDASTAANESMPPLAVVGSDKKEPTDK